MKRGNLDGFPIWVAGNLNLCGPLAAFLWNRLHWNLGRCTGLQKADAFTIITALFGPESMKEQQKIFCFLNYQEKDIELINSHFSFCIKKWKAKQGENMEESSYHVTSQISIHNQEVLCRSVQKLLSCKNFI